MIRTFLSDFIHVSFIYDLQNNEYIISLNACAIWYCVGCLQGILKNKSSLGKLHREIYYLSVSAFL